MLNWASPWWLKTQFADINLEKFSHFEVWNKGLFCKSSFEHTDLFCLQEEEGYVVYENHMSSSYEVGLGPRGAITRDSHFEWVSVKSISLMAFVTHWGFLRCKSLCSLPTGCCSSVAILPQRWRLLSWRWTAFLHLCPSLLWDSSEWRWKSAMDSVTQRVVWKVSSTGAV